MAHSVYLDKLTKDEYLELTKKLWELQNHKCFICGEEIDLDLHRTNIDHIIPLVNNGNDDISNMALTHEHCNKSKQDADLSVARRLHTLNSIIKDAENAHETPSLKHVLIHFGGSKYKFKSKEEDEYLVYSFGETGDNKIYRSQIFQDALSGEKTAFIKVPIEYLYHDEIINPRGINSSIGLLVKEFYKHNPQLHLSLGRLYDDKILIFDGQHKAVAQLLLGVKEIVVRLFISPDVDRLIETNTTAGSKLKQIAFDKSIVRQLHDTLYADRLRRYQKEHDLSEDNFSFSEQQLVDYFKGDRGNVKLYIINSQKTTITRNTDNKLQSFINFEGRKSLLPLSYSTFEKTLLSTFVDPKVILSTPINYKTDEGLNPRFLERDQLIKLCNIIAEELLIDKYDDTRGTYHIESDIAEGKGDDILDSHLVACRLFKEEIMNTWIEYLELLIKNHFAYTGVMYNDNLFQQKFPDQLWTSIQNYFVNLRDLPIWKDRSMAATIFGGKNNYDYWRCIFSTGSTPEGTSVLAKPINVTEMIRS